MSSLPQPSAPPAVPATRPAGRSVLSADLRIVGDLTAEGTVEVLGEVEGSIRARALVVAPEGRVAGTVTAESVDLRGKMEGSIGCDTLSLRAAAQMTADVVYRSLGIESGATVEGSFKKPKD